MIPTAELCSGDKPAILTTYRAKFVIIARGEKHYLFADDTVQWHNEVFQRFLTHAQKHGEDNPEKHYFPQGGGKIEVKNGTVRLYDSSKGYGRFDMEIAHELITHWAALHDIDNVVIE